LKGELSKIHKLGPKSTENLKKDLEKEDLLGAQYFNLFRFALQSPDPVTRFMFLYSILLVMCGDSQKKVDKFIQKIDPNVEVTESPHDGKPKTIYTRLLPHFLTVEGKHQYLNMVFFLPALITVQKLIKSFSSPPCNLIPHSY